MSLNLKERYGLLINNEWVAASDGAEFNVYNPANGEQLAICAEATKDDVDKAVDAATEAFKTWKTVSQVDRADYLLKIADAIDAHKEYLAQVETYDNGKPIRETLNVIFHLVLTISVTSLVYFVPKKAPHKYLMKIL